MTTAQFIAFRDYILSQNTYFDAGYAIAYKDAETKQVLCRDDKGNVSVLMPDDRKDMFYIRLDGDIKFNPDTKSRASDCGVGRLGFQDSLSGYIVCSVKEADPFKIVNNIRHTIQKYTGWDMCFATNSNIIRELVVYSELSGLKETDISSALQRLKNQTIVKIGFAIVQSYQPTNCIVNPCKDC